MGKSLAVSGLDYRSARRVTGERAREVVFDAEVKENYQGVGRYVVARDGGREDDVPWPVKL